MRASNLGNLSKSSRFASSSLQCRTRVLNPEYEMPNRSISCLFSSRIINSEREPTVSSFLGHAPKSISLTGFLNLNPSTHSNSLSLYGTRRGSGGYSSVSLCGETNRGRLAGSERPNYFSCKTFCDAPFNARNVSRFSSVQLLNKISPFSLAIVSSVCVYLLRWLTERPVCGTVAVVRPFISIWSSFGSVACFKSIDLLCQCFLTLH